MVCPVSVRCMGKVRRERGGKQRRASATAGIRFTVHVDLGVQFHIPGKHARATRYVNRERRPKPAIGRK